MPVRKESEGIQMELRFLFLGQLDRFFLQVAIKGIKLIISDHQTFAIGQEDNIILIFFLRPLPVLKIQWTPITISMLGLS